MKIYCAKCKENIELNLDELKEVSEFIMKNNLEAVDYLNYMSLKVGKKCTDGKKHTFLFDIEWQEQLIKSVRDIKDISEKQISNKKLIEDLESKMKELEHQKEIKITENADLSVKEFDVFHKVIETTGNDKLELWK